MNTFTVNGKEYKAKAFDFNLVCDLEDMGISIEEMGVKKISTLRAYFALCTGRGVKYAGEEMESHFINGGDFIEIAEAMNREMEISDFFQTLIKRTEKEVATEENQED